MRLTATTIILAAAVVASSFQSHAAHAALVGVAEPEAGLQEDPRVKPLLASFVKQQRQDELTHQDGSDELVHRGLDEATRAITHMAEELVPPSAADELVSPLPNLANPGATARPASSLDTFTRAKQSGSSSKAPVKTFRRNKKARPTTALQPTLTKKQSYDAARYERNREKLRAHYHQPEVKARVLGMMKARRRGEIPMPTPEELAERERIRLERAERAKMVKMEGQRRRRRAAGPQKRKYVKADTSRETERTEREARLQSLTEAQRQQLLAEAKQAQQHALDELYAGTQRPWQAWEAKMLHVPQGSPKGSKSTHASAGWTNELNQHLASSSHSKSSGGFTARHRAQSPPAGSEGGTTTPWSLARQPSDDRVASSLAPPSSNSHAGSSSREAARSTPSSSAHSSDTPSSETSSSSSSSSESSDSSLGDFADMLEDDLLSHSTTDQHSIERDAHAQ